MKERDAAIKLKGSIRVRNTQEVPMHAPMHLEFGDTRTHKKSEKCYAISKTSLLSSARMTQERRGARHASTGSMVKIPEGVRKGQVFFT